MEKLSCSICLEDFLHNDNARRRTRALLHCCNHLLCVECVKCILDAHAIRNYWNGALNYLQCPICRATFYRYCSLNQNSTEIVEEWTLPGYTASQANNAKRFQGILAEHKRLGYDSAGLEKSKGDSMSEDAAKKIAASMLRRIALTKPTNGKTTSPEWVCGMNNLLEAVIFLSPQFAIYHAQDRCKILKEIHIDPVLAEERERHSAAAKQRKILQELAEKKEKERIEKAHQAARKKPVPKKAAKKAPVPKKAMKKVTAKRR